MYFNESPSVNANNEENGSWKRPIKVEEPTATSGLCPFTTGKAVPVKVKEEIASATSLPVPVIIPSAPSVQVGEWGTAVNPIQNPGQTFAQQPLGWNPYQNFLPYGSVWPQPQPTLPTVHSLDISSAYNVPPPLAFPDGSICNTPVQNTNTSQANSGRSFVPDPNNSREIYEWVHSLNKNSSNNATARDRNDYKKSSHSSSSSRYKENPANASEREHSPGYRSDRNRRYSDDKYSKDRGESNSSSRRPSNSSHNGRRYRDEDRSKRDDYRSSQARGRDRESDSRSRRRSRDKSPNIKKETNIRSTKDNSKSFRSDPSGKYSSNNRSRDKSKDRSRRRESPEKDSLKKSSQIRNPVREDKRDSRIKESQKDGSSKFSRGNSNRDSRKRRSSSRQRSAPIKRERSDIERDGIQSDADFDADAIIEEPDQDVLEDIGEVEKWVRSAPDDLYYERLLDGEVRAKERTKLLCDKFYDTLIQQAETARVEAEKLGSEKMDELYKRETEEIAAQKECQEKSRKKSRKLKKSGISKVPSPSSSSETSKENSNSDGKGESQFSDLITINGAVDNNPVSIQSNIEDSLEPSSNASISTNETPSQSLTATNDNSEESSKTAIPEKTALLVPKRELEEGEVDGSDENEEIETETKPNDDIMGEAISSDEELLNREDEKDRNRKSAPETNKSNNIPSKEKEKCCHQNKGKSKCKENTSTKAKSSCKTAKESSLSQCKSKCNQGKKKKVQATTKSKACSSSGSSSDSDSDSKEGDSESDSSDDDPMSRSDTANRELERRKKHPRRLHVELWHNDPGLMNDGPVCRCSAKARRCGIRHGFYPGETVIPLCDPFSNNSKALRHYRITISPPKNFLVNTPTVIDHDGHEYIFEGFSLFSHYPIDINLPPCRVIRFNIRYDVFVEEEKFPDSFCVKELMMFEKYIFREILELVDLQYDCTEEDGCPQFHLMPRFVRQLPDNGKEILSMSRVLLHLLRKNKELVKEEDLHTLYTVEQTDWQNFADKHKGMIVTKWGMKPSSIRVDQIDRDVSGQEQEDDGIPFPLIVHFGIRPPQLSYAGNAGYQRAWRRYVKYRHLLSNMPKPTAEDKRKLLVKELKLQEMRTASTMKRDVTVAISSKGFRTTGVCCDLVQHAMLIPVLVAHLRFHNGLAKLEATMSYQFKNRYLLQLAMTHPSYRENFGTNPDHARNALTNCGIRQPEYGDRRIHYASTRKRGINTLINIMARFGAEEETESEITHNERLEFLGDAVVEFVTSIHLYHIFPDLEEGGLATYRAAIVQNQHLAVLAQALELDQFMLYAHGSDLCHDSELRHAMANCFEALMGALFLDGGTEVWSQINVADRVFGQTLFGDDKSLWRVWTFYPKHPLQSQEPNGDRHWIKSHTVLQKLIEFEDSIGVEFTHIRLLARAFTDRSLGYNNLSQGSNQRLEFLGDTVLQLISSEYLYRHFPDHHEGHLSLLRSSLVNNRTQSLVCDDLGMTVYAMRGDPKSEMKTKDRADLLEAFLGALYIDKGLKHCVVFCSVCFFPRLNKSIIKQEWNDPKSKLQQCCLTLRAMDGREPDIPVYKVTESLGPTNTRIYIVAVYFRGKRLATAQGHSIQEAEMNAAALALEVSGHLFPQLHHQKRIIDKTNKKHG